LQAFEDGSIEDACPPLRALLSIMAHGMFEGRGVHHPAIRQLFPLEAIQGSDWYQRRLAARRRGDERLWRRHVAALDAWLAGNAAVQSPLADEMCRRQEYATTQLRRVTTPAYLESLRGTLGTDPSLTASLEGH